MFSKNNLAQDFALRAHFAPVSLNFLNMSRAKQVGRYQVVAVRTRPVDEDRLDERIDLSKCHAAERDKVGKIARAYMEFGGFHQELKAAATDGKSQTVLSIGPWKEEVSIPVLANTFHSKKKRDIDVDYDSIIDTRVIPLTGELRVLIRKTSVMAVEDDRMAAAPQPVTRAIKRARAADYEDEDDEEDVQSAEDDASAPIDVSYYNRPRPYIPKRR